MDETSDIAGSYDSESPDSSIPQFDERPFSASIFSEPHSKVGRHRKIQSAGPESLTRPTTNSRRKASGGPALLSQALEPQSPRESTQSYDHPLTIEELTDQGGTHSTHQHSHSPPLPPIYSSTPIWPLTDPSEAFLLRHFVQNLAIWVRD